MIDCDVHNDVPRVDALFPYLPEYWIEHITNTLFKGPTEPVYPPGSPIAARPESGTDLPTLTRQVLDEPKVDVAILNCLYAIDSLHNPDAAIALASAVNDWQIAEWLERDPRWRASIVVPSQLPAQAAREIDRAAEHKGFVQVLLPARSQHPYGSRLYHPMWEAVARHDLKVAIHFGGTPGNPPTPSGWPSYFYEEYAGMATVFASQITSMISEGVFDQFPSLRVVLLESGFTWLPSHMWRFDKEWRNLRRLVPWVKQAPSAYIREHVRVTIQPLDAPEDPRFMLQVVDQLGSEDMLLYASDYPHVHAGDAEAFLSSLPRALAHKFGTQTLPRSTTYEEAEMVVTEARVEERKAPTRRALIDCDFHNELDSIKDLYPYLSQRWREHIDAYGTRGAPGGYYPRFMDHREERRPPSGRKSGSEVAHSRKDFLDPYNVAFATLIPLTPAGRQQNGDLDAALATAVNDWQVAEWLDPEPRLRASMVIPFEDPSAAVAEIERRAHDKRFVQVQFMGRPHEPMGRRKYWPIYEACASHGLHVMSHAFGSNGNPITGTGWPSFYLEDHVGPAQAMQANIISMVAEGVFDRFPTLKLVSVENGFGWIPSLMWRMDNAWTLLRSEVPHLKHAPSEYIRQHVYLTTQPVEEPHKPEYFLQLMEQYGDMASHILFASDYPHWDSDNPDMALPPQLPEALKQKIYFDNAKALFSLP